MTQTLTSIQKDLLIDLSNGAARLICDTKGRVTLFTSGDVPPSMYNLPALSTIQPEGLGLSVAPLLPRTLYSMVAKKALQVIDTYTGQDGVTRVLYGPVSSSTVSKEAYRPRSNTMPDTF
jgi:hypothetical protein